MIQINNNTMSLLFLLTIWIIVLAVMPLPIIIPFIGILYLPALALPISLFSTKLFIAIALLVHLLMYMWILTYLFWLLLVRWNKLKPPLLFPIFIIAMTVLSLITFLPIYGFEGGQNLYQACPWLQCF